MPDTPHDADQTNQTPADSDRVTDGGEQPPVPGRTPEREESEKLKDAPIADPPPPGSLKPR